MPSQIRHLMKASGLSRAPAALSLKKSPQYPLYCKLKGPQCRSERGAV
jgi:hypothetical protein